MKYKNRPTFAYYSTTFWDFKSVPKTWQKLKAKYNFYKKMSKYRKTVYYDFKSQFFVIFLVITGTVYSWKYRFLSIYFPKSRNTVLKIFFFPSTGKYNMSIKFQFIINIDFFQRFCLTVSNCNVLYLNASVPLSTQKQMTFFMVRFRLIVSKPCIYCF